jgi:hypothetical protein
VWSLDEKLYVGQINNLKDLRFNSAFKVMESLCNFSLFSLFFLGKYAGRGKDSNLNVQFCISLILWFRFVQIVNIWWVIGFCVSSKFGLNCQIRCF